MAFQPPPPQSRGEGLGCLARWGQGMLEGSVGRAKGSASTEPHTLPGHKLNMALWHTNQKPKIRRRTSYYLLLISPPHPLDKGNQEKQFSCRTLRFLREGSRWTEQAPACQRPGTSSSSKTRLVTECRNRMKISTNILQPCPPMLLVLQNINT